MSFPNCEAMDFNSRAVTYVTERTVLSTDPYGSLLMTGNCCEVSTLSTTRCFLAISQCVLPAHKLSSRSTERRFFRGLSMKDVVESFLKFKINYIIEHLA